MNPLLFSFIRSSRSPRGAVFLLAVLIGGLPLSAQTLIQFDFGSAAGGYAGSNAPGHDAGDFAGGDTTWNEITADASSGLFYADGSAASGITVDLGLGDSSAVDWGTAPSLGSESNLAIGVFGTALGNDNFYTTGGSMEILGVRVTGLAAGTYNVYGIARGVTSGQTDYRYNQAIGVGDSGDTTFSAIGGSSILSSLSDSSATSWVEGETHLFGQVTVTNPSDYLIFMTQAIANSGSFGNGYAGLQGLQIAEVSAVPEPATWAACVGVVVLAFAGWRRRSRAKAA